MLTLQSYLRSTIGQKKVMGLTGLGLVGFVLLHMLGNMLLFVGPKAYNSYGHGLTTGPLYYVMEAGLLGLFALHIFLGIRLTIGNGQKRETRYARPTNGEKAASVASRSMIHHGMVLLVFLIYHLITFRFGTVYEVTHDGIVMRDLYRLVLEVFEDPAYVVGYLVALLALGFHLSHGIQSSFQSLGLTHPKYRESIHCLGWFLTIAIVAGFMAQPIFAFLQN